MLQTKKEMAGNITKLPNPTPKKKDELTAKPINGILSNLLCSTCQNYLQAPILICTSGHNICGICHSKSKDSPCSVCKLPFNGQRNLAIEKIAEELFSPCPNSTFGCLYRAPENELKNHFEDCTHRQYLCPLAVFGNCLWTGSMSQMKTHVKKTHPEHTNYKFGGEIKLSNFDTKTENEDFQVVFYGKNVFVVHAKIDSTKNTAFWTVQIIGNRAKAEKMNYEFSLYRKNTDQTIKVTDKCSSIEKDFEDLVTMGLCVGIPLNVLSRFITPKKELTFTITIKNK